MIHTHLSSIATQSFLYITEYNHEIVTSEKLIFTPYNCYILIYVLNGSGKIVQNHESVEIKRDSFLFANSTNLTPTLIKTTNSLDYYLFVINGNNLNKYYDIYKQTNNHSFLHHKPMSTLIKYLFDDMIHLLDSSTHEDLLVDIEISKILTIIISDLITGKLNQVNNSMLKPTYLEQVKEYIDKNFNQKITLDDLAKHCQISKYQLAHDFKQHFDISPINYLINVRLNEAKHLLVNTSQRITAISLSIGFNNTNHFINLFKKQTGLTPLQYRKIYGKSA